MKAVVHKGPFKVAVENIPTSLIQHGKFNCPHGLGAGVGGNLDITEWLIDGRMVKLVKAG